MKHGYYILGIVHRYRVRTGTRYSYGTFWVRTDDVPILFLFFCNGYTCGTPMVRAWYTNPKKCNFFPFFYSLLLFIGAFISFIFFII
jgi:hypothetical protein